MRKSSTLVMLTLVVFSYQTLADNPPAPAEKSETATPAVAPAPAAATASEAIASPAKPAASADAGKSAAEEAAAEQARDKRYLAMGYKPVKRDGGTLYCRKESVIGTRFTRMNCRTAETLERTAQSAQDEANSAMRRGLNQVQSN